MKVVADVGNLDYYVTRAIEFLQTSKTYADNSAGYEHSLYSALGLIALALAEAENEHPEVKNKG